MENISNEKLMEIIIGLQRQLFNLKNRVDELEEAYNYL